jgi:hypothetical protein
MIDHTIKVHRAYRKNRIGINAALKLIILVSWR